MLVKTTERFLNFVIYIPLGLSNLFWGFPVQNFNKNHHMPLCYTTLISNLGYQESAVVLCEGFESDPLDFVKAVK